MRKLSFIIKKKLAEVMKLNLKTKDMIIVSIFSALMVVGAFIRIPFPMLPITLQPFFCALAGILLGSRLGLLSQLVYIALGLAGLPVFAQGAGISYVLKPSFGFLLGFAVCAFVIGKLSEFLKTTNLRNVLISLISGLVAVYAVGMTYMYIILNLYMKIPGITALYVLSFNLPYVIKDLILYVIVAISVVSALPVIKKAGLAAS